MSLSGSLFKNKKGGFAYASKKYLEFGKGKKV